jgi:hypothetical protein
MESERHDRERRSELFTVRLWQENLGDNQVEWRGKVQHVQGGEAFYFCEWSMLITALLKMLSEPESPAQTD